MYGLPVRLLIPKIKVDAKVEQMGLTPAGDMDVPKSLADVGWYKYGPRPGNTGSSVITGHLSGVKEPGIFKDLKKLQKGDKINVIDDKGQTLTFIVREAKKYVQAEKPSEVFNISDGAHLNLVTCAGTWDKTRHLFSERLVIFTDKID